MGGRAKAAIEVTTDSGGSNPEICSKPAIEVAIGFGPPAMPAEPDGKRSVSACEAYGEMIAVELSLGRNAKASGRSGRWARVCGGGYQSVKRFVRKLRGAVSPEVRVIIETRPAEDYGEFRVMVRTVLPGV